MPQPRTPVARVRDLSVTYVSRGRRAEAIRDVNLEIGEGEVVAIVGESGSGKTTLGLALFGLLPRGSAAETDGHVEVAGVSVLDADPAALRRLRQEDVGVVFQEPASALDPTMRVGGQLTERGASVETATALLRECEVSDPAERLRQYAFELSGGIAQRVMIAGALASRPRAPGDRSVPRLVVADEPTTALDATTRVEVLRLFDRLRQRHNCALVLITHDLVVATRLADSAVVMYGGRVCEAGPAEQVFLDPRHRYTKALLDAHLTADRGRPIRDIPGHPPSAYDRSPGCPFEPRCSVAEDRCRSLVPPLERDAHGRATACFVPVAPRTSPPPDERADHPRAADTADAAVTGDDVVLEMRDISKLYAIGGRRGRQRAAVQDVSIELRGGRALAVVGESGSGKTTLLRIAARLIEPDAGAVRWNGASGPPQLIHQNFGAALTPWLTIRTQLAERLRVCGVPRAEHEARIAQLLADVGLDERVQTARARELSGGQRQRVVIARALASNPGTLLCDEPTSALDASFAVRVVTLLRDLKTRLRLALLVVTHDIAVASHLAEEVAVMRDGRILERGPTADVLADPRHEYTAALIEAARVPLGGSPRSAPGKAAISPALHATGEQVDSIADPPRAGS